MNHTLNENQLQRLRETYCDRYVSDMDTKTMIQYIYDDMLAYMERLPHDEVIDECKEWWGDYFDEIIDEVKE